MIILFLLASLSISNPVSAEQEIDNWPDGDAWLKIELVSWIGNETVEWDNNNGLPDPYFEICVDADDTEVKGAELKDGLLKVSLERIIPEAKKPRQIEIQ